MSNADLFQLRRVKPGRSAAASLPGIDRHLLLPILLLATIGIVMVFSASYPMVLNSGKESISDLLRLDAGKRGAYEFALKQFIFALLGGGVLFAFSRLRQNVLRSSAYPALLVAFVFLVLVLKIGREINGAHSWIQVGPVNFQPSEFAKVALMLTLARLFADRAQPPLTGRELLLPLLIAGLVCGLVLLEKDFGTTAVIFSTILVMLFLAGARIKHLLALAVSAGVVGAIFVYTEPYRLDRILSFIDPVRYADSGGYQIQRALIAIGSGGPFGLGFSHSREKFFYLPTPHTDCIFAVTAEELGLFFCLGILALFFWLGWRGLKIAASSRDRFAALATAGMTNLIIIEAATNLLVILGLMPPTGLPLPFISYGGSSLVFSMMAVGIIANFSRSLPESSLPTPQTARPARS